jgi:hypothetical protein
MIAPCAWSLHTVCKSFIRSHGGRDEDIRTREREGDARRGLSEKDMKAARGESKWGGCQFD